MSYTARAVRTDTLTCDRCGVVSDAKLERGQDGPTHSLDVPRPTVNNLGWRVFKWGVHDSLLRHEWYPEGDLCPACSDSMTEWLKGGIKNAPTS